MTRGLSRIRCAICGRRIARGRLFHILTGSRNACNRCVERDNLYNQVVDAEETE